MPQELRHSWHPVPSRECIDTPGKNNRQELVGDVNAWWDSEVLCVGAIDCNQQAQEVSKVEIFSKQQAQEVSKVEIFSNQRLKPYRK